MYTKQWSAFHLMYFVERCLASPIGSGLIPLCMTLYREVSLFNNARRHLKLNEINGHKNKKNPFTASSLSFSPSFQDGSLKRRFWGTLWCALDQRSRAHELTAITAAHSKSVGLPVPVLTVPAPETQF